MARTSGETKPCDSLALATVDPGTSSRKRLTHSRPSSVRPSCPQAAALNGRTAIALVFSCKARSAHSTASSYRPAFRRARARPPSNIQRCGSSGLKRIARWSASIARAGQFEKPWTHPLKFQARAELGLSSRARSIAPRPTARSPAKITMAQPPIHKASGSSLPGRRKAVAACFEADIEQGGSRSLGAHEPSGMRPSRGVEGWSRE